MLDRLVLFPAKDLTADEAAHVLWAFAILEEVRSHENAHRFAMELAQEASKKQHEFSPNLMASFVTSLTRLIRSSDEDDLVGKITTNFSDYALGSGALPRFPPEELRVWKTSCRKSPLLPIRGQRSMVLFQWFDPLMDPGHSGDHLGPDRCSQACFIRPKVERGLPVA